MSVDSAQLVSEEIISKLIAHEKEQLADSDLGSSPSSSLVKCVFKVVQNLATLPDDDDATNSQLVNQYTIAYGLSSLYGTQTKKDLVVDKPAKKRLATNKRLLSFSKAIEASSNETIRATLDGDEENFKKLVIRAKLAQLWINTAVARGDRQIDAMKSAAAELNAWIAYAKGSKLEFDMAEGQSMLDMLSNAMNAQGLLAQIRPAGGNKLSAFRVDITF